MLKLRKLTHTMMIENLFKLRIKSLFSNAMIFFSITFYPAYSGVGRGNSVLRHCDPHLPSNFPDIACRVAELNTVLCLIRPVE